MCSSFLGLILFLGSAMNCLNPRGIYRVGKDSYTFIFPKSRLVSEPDFFVPCGKCALCLRRRRQEWSRRMLLETYSHSSSSFLTLTYNDGHLPSDSLVSKSDVQNFIKRFRNCTRDYGLLIPDFKYFVVSEYGKKFDRPHYHAIFFGVNLLDACWRPSLVSVHDGHPVYSSSVLSDIWGNGYTTVDECTPATINYVSKYIIKDFDSPDNFYLYSRGLGKSFFCDGSTLRSNVSQSIHNGFIALPDGKGSAYKSGLPRWLDRYIKAYDPDLFFSYRLKKSYFASLAKKDMRTASERVAFYDLEAQREQMKRRLDNEI